MKRYLLLILILTLLISGCNQGTENPSDGANKDSLAGLESPFGEDENEGEKSEINVNFNKFEGPPGDAVVLIINLPTPEQMLILNVSQVLTLQKTDEKIIFIPKYEHSEIKVYSMDINGEGNLEILDEIYHNPDCDKDFSLGLQTMRSEGIPNYKIVVKLPNDLEKEYLLITDGKNGNPNIEYLIN